VGAFSSARAAEVAARPGQRTGGRFLWREFAVQRGSGYKCCLKVGHFINPKNAQLTSMIASVQPSRLPASNSSARRRCCLGVGIWAQGRSKSALRDRDAQVRAGDAQRLGTRRRLADRLYFGRAKGRVDREPTSLVFVRRRLGARAATSYA
jgi:hypothetical protein